MVECSGCDCSLVDLIDNGIHYDGALTCDPDASPLVFTCTDNTASQNVVTFRLVAAYGIGNAGACKPNADNTDCVQNTPCTADVTMIFETSVTNAAHWPDALTVVFQNPFGTGTTEAEIFPSYDENGNPTLYGSAYLLFDGKDMSFTHCGESTTFAPSVSTLAPSADGFTFAPVGASGFTVVVTCDPCECAVGAGGGGG